MISDGAMLPNLNESETVLVETDLTRTPPTDHFPQAMVEGTTEYDWAELPDWLQDVMRHAADEFRRWADAEPIAGELAYEIEAPADV